MIKRIYSFTFVSAIVSATTGFVIAHLINSSEEPPVIEKVVELSAIQDVEEIKDEPAAPEIPVVETSESIARSKRQEKSKILGAKYGTYLSTTRGTYSRENKKGYFLHEINLKLSYLSADQQALPTEEYSKYLEKYNKIGEEYKEWVDVHNHIEEVVDYDNKNP